MLCLDLILQVSNEVFDLHGLAIVLLAVLADRDRAVLDFLVTDDERVRRLLDRASRIL